MLNNEAYIFEDSIIKFINENVRVYNVASGKTFIKDISFFNEIVSNPVTIQQMLALKGSELRKAKLMIHKQQKYKKLAEAIVRLKDDLHR